MTDERIAISLSEEEKRRVRTAAARRDQSMSEFGYDVLSEWLDEHAEEQLAD
jgi:uncharacterized protein (DUF1778 family)